MEQSENRTEAEKLRLDALYADWRYEVANGDTLLGFAEWQEHQKESRNTE